MPQITVGEETFHRLTERAAALKISVEQLVAPLLDDAANDGIDGIDGINGINGHTASRLADLPYDEWKKRFDVWMMEVQARADRYPPGFVLDDSRESLYKGCGE